MAGDRSTRRRVARHDGFRRGRSCRNQEFRQCLNRSTLSPAWHPGRDARQHWCRLSRRSCPQCSRSHGCLVYTAHDSRERPGTIVMYEVWESQAALDVHAAGPNFGALAARFGELLDEPLAIEHLRKID
ncbi:antibiotic biosynthesis monooxygenase [Methylobacterium tardum]|uniref:putative quinol monooxygenase n=1 Tax=Methylobacterium tardum TaxID=374432 RepID=UPI0020220375|nr:putative quinol monooxygenase [Methylobacterium tardum]URD35091.1 antibiotic biosynthesis monooxygenase [Methylobacterium tardum]